MPGTTTPPYRVHLGVDLTDAGAHPAAWSTAGARTQRLFDARRLVELVATAERGLLDLVTLDDAFSPQHGRGARGRLDAALVASRLAPRSVGIGLVPTVSTTHAEPFHVSRALATIDHVSNGRAGWQVGWSTTPADAAASGRRGPQRAADGVAEAAEVVGAVACLWEGWEDGATRTRDVASGRSRDREAVHRVDRDGIRFVVDEAPTVPRPPQGRPPVVVRVTSPESEDLAVRRADVVRVRTSSRDEAVALRERLRSAAADVGRRPDDLRVLVDAYVVVGQDRASAQARLDLIEDLEGVSWDTGSLTHVGTARDLAATVEDWTVAGAADGFLLRPSSLSTDLDAVVQRVVPLLQRAGLFRTEYPGTTLRETLGLAGPAHRSAAIA
ncbi:LLM class flavin-dependent oxidoreductase [Cellulosimicrobium sp. Marseille-Q4280]|uniref:LLM class flavin-dependent oxidoreductase n=1 Tax=Cellulosimicrobium sp. Marseille-Q4280 TaxID=2937992 RepID=UPI00203AB1BD|nr:LLM class flavin-dependent oxidoreductase [Cellulosimicrobium sp. Marseille-Q4280]